jgi:hypothetical protein
MIRVLIEVDGQQFDQFVIDDSYSQQAEDYFISRINDSIKAAARESARPKQPGDHPLDPKILNDDPRMDRDPRGEPLPFEEGEPDFDPRATFDEQDCILPGYEDHIHCEVHGQCIPLGTDCPDCMDEEARANQEPEAWDVPEWDGEVHVRRMTKAEGDDIRTRMEQDPIDGHDPDCQCSRCQIGDDAHLWLHHPEDY